MTQHITSATRKGKTLIDHISSNIPERLVHQGVIPADEISDHDLTYVIRNIKKHRFEPRYKNVRNEKNFNINEYINDFSKIPFSVVYSFDDPNDQLDTFNKLVTECINKHAPIQRTKFTRPPAPWMKDPDITSSKDTLQQLRKAAETDVSKARYRKHRNAYKKLIRKKKGDFIRKSLSSKKPKEIWNTVHRILDPPSQRIRHDPESLNRYYTILAAGICNKTNAPFNETEILNNLPEDEADSFTIIHTSYEEIRKIILDLRNDCSSGFDQIPAKLMKPVVDYITSPLVHIINSSIDNEVFPDQWKTARVCPIPKTKHPTKLKDFRPVSILPLLSKVYEKVILKQLLNYVETKIYNNTQSGFRKGHSTATLLLKLRDDIRKAMNANEITLAVLIDYSKAFDTLDHAILLKKLSTLGFDKKSVKIIMNYLTNRRQFVQIEDKCSDMLPIYFGVPQGSILGPILFNLYVAELPEKIKSESIQYADDTTVYKTCTLHEIHHNLKVLEEDISALSSWSKQNGLIFNGDKLQFIIFRKKRSLCPTDRSFLMRANNKSIKQEVNVKLLGITFDQNLSWTDHINNTTKSSYSTLQVLKRFKRFTPMRVRKTLAETLILSRLSYCNSVYSQVPRYLTNRLQRVQTCAAGYVLGRYAKIRNVVDLKWLPVEESISFSLVKYAFQAMNNPVWPSYLPLRTVERRRNLRSNDSGLKLRNGDRFSFEEQASVAFNDLPKSIRECYDKAKFGREAKKYYIDQALAKAV